MRKGYVELPGPIYSEIQRIARENGVEEDVLMQKTINLMFLVVKGGVKIITNDEKKEEVSFF